MSSPEGEAGALPAAKLFSPGGLATGIGSLPYVEAGEAVEMVLRHLPEIPFWPQLPRRTPLEGMTLQYLEGFPGVRDPGGGRDPIVELGEESLAEVEAFYGRALADDLGLFALSPERAPGFYTLEEALVQATLPLRAVKGHITGPVTLSSSLRDAAGREIAYDDTFREVTAIFVARKARWQAERLGRFGVPVILFLDEPVMEVYGSAYSALTEAIVEALWAPSLEALREVAALSGIHCCGNTDWELLFRSGVDIVNFDAFHYLDRMLLYPQALAAYLEGGGVLAWGIVPTSERAAGLTTDDLWERLSQGMARFAEAGVDPDLLRRQCLLTPSCGMGSLDSALARHVLGLVSELSRRFRGVSV
ncbi:MAG: hypothetical protein HY900_14195 [Deltaproteobacteria bacterium]|nr:hypothetical protein [Deltaproteobacteria bacterium]